MTDTLLKGEAFMAWFREYMKQEKRKKKIQEERKKAIIYSSYKYDVITEHMRGNFRRPKHLRTGK